jgi:hypothetical protein
MLALLSVLAGPAAAIENPTSSGEVSMVETNLVRVPKTDKPPTIDGKMEPEVRSILSLRMVASGRLCDFKTARWLFPVKSDNQATDQSACARDSEVAGRDSAESWR